eukprot:5510854-Pyramimonas_sp.AAC.1
MTDGSFTKSRGGLRPPCIELPKSLQIPRDATPTGRSDSPHGEELATLARLAASRQAGSLLDAHKTQLRWIPQETPT